MAIYKNLTYLLQEKGGEFDRLHSPGGDVPLSGIYRCEGCGKSISIVRGNTFPPQNHHQHSPTEGEIYWRLVVKSSPS